MTATLNRLSTDRPSTGPLANVTLRDVIKTIPKECFEKNSRKAWQQVALCIVMAIVGYVAIALSPWFLLPAAWFLAGTALTGWFVVGHDCGHRSFSRHRWVNNLVGHIAFLPLIYPFHPWRLLHDHHHRHTNKQEVDNAWHPWYVEDFTGESKGLRLAYWLMRGRLWWLASIIHWAGIHFDLNNFTERDKPKAKVSIAVVVIFAAIVFPTLIATLGVWGWVKFWLMPWLGYHFWMSTFTLVHHTAPDIQFRPTETWNEVEAQLAGTVHCDYPKWVEVLCHDISVHVPHHISTGIPSYNLRLAHQSLKDAWGDRVHIREEKFTWNFMRGIVDQCHLYHAEHAYTSFKALRRSR